MTTDSISESDNWPPEFSLDRERILTLLTGDRFYANASAALREAVLNAIDAVHRRRTEDPAHDGAIQVVYDDEALTLTISDNGDGMSQTDVAALFATIGASASQIDPHGVGTVGEFGIGVVSYFMAADEFEIDTFDGSDGPIALRFHRSMFAGGAAEERIPQQTERGTRLTLFVRDEELYRLLRQEFPHWCREVENLHAVDSTSGEEIHQGAAGGPEQEVNVQYPDGVESASIGPIAGKSAWTEMTGASTISILYRGVFVQDYTKIGLWGMKGSVSVDPKHFKPRLNREGFVGDGFAAEIDAFLQTAHPLVLRELAQVLADAVASNTLDDWSARRWATLWLSVPRDPAYQDAATRWDAVFRSIPAFEVAHGERWDSASVDDLVGMPGPIYVAPHREAKQNDVIKSASRLLRETGATVVRGLERERGWLQGASNYFTTTAELIGTRFSDELPELRSISEHAEAILESLEVVHTLYGGDHPVELAPLGADAPPVLKVRQKLFINTSTDDGRRFIHRSIELNRGRNGLIEVSAEIAPQYLSQVASVALAQEGSSQDILGLVKRRVVRDLLG